MDRAVVLFLTAAVSSVLVCTNAGTLQELQKRARELTPTVGGNVLYSSQHEELARRELFQDFVRYFRKVYEPNTLEYEKRYEIFLQSLLRHQKMNLEEKKYQGAAQYGLNQFSDLTTDEFRDRLGKENELSPGVGKPIMKTSQGGSKKSCSFNERATPKYKNWVKEGKVSSVKNQGKCGSCWAFAGAEQVESYWAIAGHPVVDLSVQELLSCAPSLGCNGGNTCGALDWLANALFNGSQLQLVPAKAYPYVDDDTECDISRLSTPGGQISMVCGCLPLIGEEHLMKNVVAFQGPMAVNVNAVMWHDYVGGIIQHHCTNLTMNHAVQLVGYDISGDIPYWLLKNSWGPDFGEEGYLRVKYGENTCGVAQGPSYVIV